MKCLILQFNSAYNNILKVKTFKLIYTITFFYVNASD